GIILFHDSTRRWHRLPGTAGAIWATIDGRRTVAMITETVAMAYDVDPASIRSDVDTMLDGLLDRQLLVQPSVG
ncbi:MAG: PqqD family protein, partial [Ilumatobacter sp.]|uniref:PqqD family protein n=1 Tax=Ilumatobacter sp. TaxID=1967498 RepID=UPI003296B984